MSRTQDSGLEGFRRDGIVAARQLVEEFRFRLDGIPETIHLRIYGGPGNARFETEQSHYLQAPGMGSPDVTEKDDYASVREAVDDVLDHFLIAYQEATAAGHEPDEGWLMPSREMEGD